MKNKEMKNKNILPGVIIFGIIASIIIYAVMLNAEKNILTEYEKGTIYVAAQEIPRGTIIQEDNYNVYFELKELDKKVIPATAISTPEELNGLIPYCKIDQGTLITTAMFESVNEVTKDMKEPVIAGFKADDLYQVVGGVLRSGDRIHIYDVEEEAGTAELIWSNIFVEQVFDSAGTSISSEDTATAAQRINVYLDKTEVEEFYAKLSSGALRVVKVCD